MDNAPMIVAVVLLVLVGVIGGLTAWITHDVSATYGDPTGSDLGNLAWGPLAGVAVLLLVLVAIAVRAAPVGARRGVALVAGLLLVAFAVAVPVANHFGLESKRSSTSQPPECGMGGETAAEFARIEHPGYFGGGESDATGCSYLLTTGDIPGSLAAYERELRGLGYDVVRTGDSLTATRGDLTFSVERGYQDIDDGRTLTVSLRTSG
jgi:hypothetical protein